jgi:hypothetical protein
MTSALNPKLMKPGEVAKLPQGWIEDIALGHTLLAGLQAIEDGAR